ncbi:MAG TPA: hypothetical protein VF666_20635 [Pyrinomonadaceae bacterium]|jgi:hypothetical protein
MYTNVNLEAALGVLGFLGTGFCLFVAGLIILHALKTKRRERAKRILAMSVAGAALYAVLVVAFSLSSSEQVLARGEEKYFCEIDCHLAYSVLHVRQTKTLGAGAQQVTANGMFHVVTLKTRFDEQTTSPRRANQPLTPNSRVARVFAEDGRRFEPSLEGQRALEQSPDGAGKPLTTPLRPGEAYTTELVFDLPPDVKNPRLLINEGEIVTHFIIGHENSFLHKKTGFQI